jgi:hypothetical protein
MMPTMNTQHASCSCGQLKLVAHGEPIGVSLCHCLACQARTGSTYAVQASYASARVSTEGTATEFVRVGDEGSRIHFFFCPVCGATVWYRINQEEVTVVPVGAFRNPAFPAPTVSVYEERMHSWVGLPASVKHIS